METILTFTSAWLWFAVACSAPGRQAAWEVETLQKPHDPRALTATASVSASDAEASVLAAGEAHWARRDDEEQVRGAIEAWERAAAAHPTHAQVMVHLARAYYFLVDGHVALHAEATNDEQLALYQKGVDWGEKALLLLEPEFGRVMREQGDYEKAAARITEQSAAATYWYCVNLGRFSLKKGLSARLYYKDRVRAMMERVLSINPKFFYAGADRYFGAFYSALPSIAGKDLDRSQRHFKVAESTAPEYLANKVVKAQFLAVELDDRAMYDGLLKSVLASPDGEDPDSAAENRAAKRTAKKMLTEIDDRF